MRVNRVPVGKCSHTVKPEDVITLVINDQVRVVKVLGEAQRRGPANHAQQLYREMLPLEKQDASPELLC